MFWLKRVVQNKQELINVPRDPVYLPENYDGKDTGAKATILNRGEGGSDTEISTYPDARYVTRKEPTIILTLLCIHPVEYNSLIPASTIG